MVTFNYVVIKQWWHIYSGSQNLLWQKSMQINLALTLTGQQGKDTKSPIAAQQEGGDRETLRVC